MSPVHTGIKLAALLAFLHVAPAFAHVVLDPAQGMAGSWLKTDLRITHGCNGAPTTKISVTIPRDVLLVKPQVKPGWIIEIDKHTLATPAKGPHGPVTEITDKISWSNGYLPDEYVDDFGLVLLVPDKAGQKIVLPVIQECPGGSHEWVETPMPKTEHMAGHDHPAPTITILPKK